MSYVVGIAWYKDEHTYRKTLETFIDSKNMPSTYSEWQSIVGRQIEEVKRTGNAAIRVDIDPDEVARWCASHGFRIDTQGRIAFVKHVELEYEMTGKGTVIE